RCAPPLGAPVFGGSISERATNARLRRPGNERQSATESVRRCGDRSTGPSESRPPEPPSASPASAPSGTGRPICEVGQEPAGRAEPSHRARGPQPSSAERCAGPRPPAPRPLRANNPGAGGPRPAPGAVAIPPGFQEVSQDTSNPENRTLLNQESN